LLKESRSPSLIFWHADANRMGSAEIRASGRFHGCRTLVDTKLWHVPRPSQIRMESANSWPTLVDLTQRGKKLMLDAGKSGDRHAM